MATGTHQSPWMNDELRVFRSKIRQFIEDEFVPNQGRWRELHRPDADAWIKAGEAGMLLRDVPQDFGGGGGSFAHTAAVLEELVQAGSPFGTREHSIVAHYILVYGSENQKRTWLPRMARGELVGAIAMTEPSGGSDLQGIKTTAHRDGDHYIVKGSKWFITNGWHASIICLPVKTDAGAAGSKGISLVIVEPKTLSGYSVGDPLKTVGLHGQDTCELFFDDVRIPASNLLGPAEGKGFFQMMEQLPYERLQIGVLAVAMAERALAITSKYVKDRKAFGKPLIDLQNTRFKMAECKTGAYIGRIFLDDCIERMIAGQLDTVTASMAKYWLTDCQNQIIDTCVQLHGSYGYLMDHPIGRMWIDCRMQRIGGGTNEIMKEMIGWSI